MDPENTVVTDQNQDQEAFAAAFEEAAPGGTPSASSEETSPGETPPEKPAGETPPEKPAGETPPGETPPGETPPGEIPPEKPAGETPPDYKKLYEEELQKNKSLDGRIKATAEELREVKSRQPKPEPVASPPAGTPPPSIKKILTDEEENIIKAFETEMQEDFMKPMRLIMKKAIHEAIGRYNIAVSEAVLGIKKNVDSLIGSTNDSHYQAILEAHEDAVEIVEQKKIHEWVDTLPYKEAIKGREILERGNTKQVIELFDQFKAANNITNKRKATSPVPKKEGEQPPVIVKPNAEKAKAAMTVKSGVGVVPKGKADKNDFAGAFEEAVASSSS